MTRIDLNCDVGESFGVYVIGDDRAVMPHVTSANIACGAHAGDPRTMRVTVRLARDHDVAIGAHPGFADLAGFGRRVMALTPPEIEDLVAYQVGALIGIARMEGVDVRHVKPHGALYNLAVTDPAVSAAVVRAVAGVDRTLCVVGLSGSALLEAGRAAGVRVVSEVFADRAYRADGRLLPRAIAGAVVDDPRLVVRRAVRMATERTVEAVDGTAVTLEADTICIHGDTPGAAALARRVRIGLESAGVTVAAAWGSGPRSD